MMSNRELACRWSTLRRKRTTLLMLFDDQPVGNPKRKV
jgi:hypothetical protein